MRQRAGREGGGKLEHVFSAKLNLVVCFPSSNLLKVCLGRPIFNEWHLNYPEHVPRENFSIDKNQMNVRWLGGGSYQTLKVFRSNSYETTFLSAVSWSRADVVSNRTSPPSDQY